MSIRKVITGIILCFLVSNIFSTSAAQEISVIPEPVNITKAPGIFTLSAETPIVISEDSPQLRHLSRYLADKLHTATWVYAEVLTNNAAADSSIKLTISLDDTPNHEEGYVLSVSPKSIEIKARSTHGLFYGVQTLLQLLPPAIALDDPTLVPGDIKWTIPSVRIEDYPRYSYRGMHLDVARHFFPVEFIKKYLDLMAMQKMNRFHWHLTEDQGWRIEIKQYPKLTEVGAWRDSTLIGHYGSETYDNIRYGGYYTQEEIKEIVQYANDRYITVVIRTRNTTLNLPGAYSTIFIVRVKRPLPFWKMC